MKLTAEEVKDMIMKGIKLPDNLVVEGDIDLELAPIKSLPNNLVVGGWLDLSYTQIESIPDDLVVGGWLDLSYTQIESIPDNLTVEGGLYLSYTQIKSLPDNLVVGGNLYLDYTQIESLPDNLTVRGNLYLDYTQIESLPDNLVVSGDLALSYTPIKSLPDNLVVGGSLDIRYTKIKSLPNNLVVGGSLDLSYTQIESIPDDLKVGKKIYIYDTKIDAIKIDPAIRPENSKYYLKEGDYVPGKYLYADDILTNIKREKKYGKYTIYVGKIKGKNVIYDGVNYAHCDKISDGIEDLEYKASKDRGVEQYKKYTLDSVVSLNEAKTMYRVITGSCRAGVNDFVDSMKEVKNEYSIQEIIDITKDAYRGYMFHDFFTNT